MADLADRDAFLRKMQARMAEYSLQPMDEAFAVLDDVALLKVIRDMILERAADDPDKVASVLKETAAQTGAIVKLCLAAEDLREKRSEKVSRATLIAFVEKFKALVATTLDRGDAAKLLERVESELFPTERTLPRAKG